MNPYVVFVLGWVILSVLAGCLFSLLVKAGREQEETK